MYTGMCYKPLWQPRLVEAHLIGECDEHVVTWVPEARAWGLSSGSKELNILSTSKTFFEGALVFLYRVL